MRLSLLIVCLWAVPASAQVGYGALGTANGQIATAAPVTPATVNAGEMLLLFVANKGPNGPDTPSGWTACANGQGFGGDGGSGADVGDVWTTVFYKVADGSEDGATVNISVTSGNGVYANILSYTKTSDTWEVACTNGADSTSATTWSIVGAADPGVTATDYVVFASGRNLDTVSFASYTLSQGGVTYPANATERFENGTSFGDDVGLAIADIDPTSGTSSAAPTGGATASTNVAGSGVIVRLREASASATPTPKRLMLMGVGDAQ